MADMNGKLSAGIPDPSAQDRFNSTFLKTFDSFLFGGAAVGATIGTFSEPGGGTVVGGVIGAGLGTLIGVPTAIGAGIYAETFGGPKPAAVKPVAMKM